MKPYKYILPILLITSLSSTAQEIRFSAGYNGSNIKETGTDKWAGRAGYQFGADVLLGNRVFVKPGINFMVRNLNYSFADTTGITPTEFKYTSRYLSVPIMLGVNFLDPTDDPPINAYVMAGLTALFNLSADLNNNNLDVQTSSSQWYVGFGAGLEFSFLFLEAGYDVALTKEFDEFNRPNLTTNPKVNYLHIVGGVRLRLAK